MFARRFILVAAGLVCLQLPSIAAAQTFITAWGSLGSDNGEFRFPVGLATDAAGNVYVADKENHRIQKFTSDGTYITQWGTPGTDDGQFQFPSGVATDADDNVYVADLYNHRVQKFGFAPTPVQNVTWGSMKARYRGESGTGAPTQGR